MNSLTSAIKNKIQGVEDFFSGTRRLDNSKNPGSAYSMAQRKQRVTTPRARQPRSNISNPSKNDLIR